MSTTIALPQPTTKVIRPPAGWAFRSDVANRKAAPLPANFEWYEWRCVGPDIMFVGAPVIGVISKGPRKGHKRYSRDTRSVVVTEAEESAAALAYETETGSCGECQSTGRVVSGWHHIEGTKYRECVRCSGSGKAPVAVDPHVGVSNG